MLASVAGVFSLFPLLFTPAGECVIITELPNNLRERLMPREETPVKIVYSLLWMYLTFRPLERRVYEYVLNVIQFCPYVLTYFRLKISPVSANGSSRLFRATISCGLRPAASLRFDISRLRKPILAK